MKRPNMKTAIILIIFQITITRTAKNNARPVHEVINEQARADDKRIPYGNPLAGNSLQNAKLHAQHQQAMFNAERVRQHRAQSQRWTQKPIQVDSYMKAYRESQENHHLALERMQGNVKDRKDQRPKTTRRIERPNLKARQNIEPVVLTRDDAVENTRNHRSYGSIYYSTKNRINTLPGTTYDQGVTIKPNGNVGLSSYKDDEPSLYTFAVPSKTQYVYPKLYSQMHSYQSAEDIHVLNSLLTKPPQEQLTQLNSLIYPNEGVKSTLESPIDLFFYVNNPGTNKLTQEVFAPPYATQFTNYKDHTPITEEVDDIEDPKARKTYSNLLPTIPATQPYIEPTTETNYYQFQQKVVNPTVEAIEYQDKPSYSALTYEKPLSYYTPQSSTEGVKYLRTKHTGVQHLTHDGTGVSAYGDDDIHYAANYEFGYRVHDHKSGNDFGHQEAKKGDKTRGQYHVLLPDGRVQQVRYSAGPDGFHADISYEHLKV